jgi:hypothetical protein
MKTILIAAGSLLLYTTLVKAQSETVYSSNNKETKQEKREAKKTARELKRNNNDVSYQTKQQFSRDFNNAQDVSWNVTENFEEATFTTGDVKMTAYYDTDSKLVGTTTLKTFSDIPLTAQEHINNHYKGYTIEAVLLFDDNEDNDTDMMLYNKMFEDADNYFVTLKNSKELIILKVDTAGEVSYFKKL